uniref:SecA family profile domain-containing protein n=1 Tax=Arcella intermedia TaxID=1963864 RepID=A0A6B2KYW0_9EUKA
MDIFRAFKIEDRIFYSKVSDMCERIINKEGNVRNLTNAFLHGKDLEKTVQQVSNRPSIILIDEVDVFFGPDFYGCTYNPATLLSNENTYAILKFIWGNRKNIQLSAVLSIEAYKDLLKMYSPKWKPLFDSQISQMLKDVTDVFEPKPHVVNNRVGYIEHDEMVFNRFHGYRTAFAYLHFLERGDITKEEVVKENIGFYIGCGNLSFAELPTDFNCIMGVTGTLSSLTEVEKKIVSNYGITRMAYAPSIYGQSRRQFSPKADVHVVQKSDPTSGSIKRDWFLKITQHCQDKIQARRAVIVFFENEEIIEEFEKEFGSSLPNTLKLLEKTEFKENVIKKSTISGNITLCSRPFGRGVDFICRDETTKGAGGVHVILTFLPSSNAEEVQIQGRTARQGDPGTFEYILYITELEEKLGFIATKIIEFDKDKTLYPEIVKARDESHKKLVVELADKRDTVLSSHLETVQFKTTLAKYDNSQKQKEQIMSTILKMNNSSIITKATSYHLYFCLDDSGSMSGRPWADLIKAVAAFCQKQIELCTSQGTQPNDIVTIINHNHTPEIMCRKVPVTSNPEKSTRFRSGGNDFSRVLNMAEQEIAQNDFHAYIPTLLFMSDGGCGNGETEMERIAKMFPTLKVFTIGFGSGCDQKKLQTMATLAGGQYYFGANGAQLIREFENISVKLSNTKFSL